MQLKVTANPATGRIKLARTDDLAFEVDGHEVASIVASLIAAVVCIGAGMEYPPKVGEKPVTFN